MLVFVSLPSKVTFTIYICIYIYYGLLFGYLFVAEDNGCTFVNHLTISNIYIYISFQNHLENKYGHYITVSFAKYSKILGAEIYSENCVK